MCCRSAFTVLALCIKAVTYMKIQPTLGFLIATLVQCCYAIRAFLFVLCLAIGAFALTFNFQMAEPALDANSTTGSLAESVPVEASTFGGRGKRI